MRQTLDKYVNIVKKSENERTLFYRETNTTVNNSLIPPQFPIVEQ